MKIHIEVSLSGDKFILTAGKLVYAGNTREFWYDVIERAQLSGEGDENGIIDIMLDVAGLPHLITDNYEATKNTLSYVKALKTELGVN